MQNKILIVCLSLFILFSCSHENYISHIWIKEKREFEEGVFTLKIDNRLHFSIEIYSPINDKGFGKIEGKLKRINSKSRFNVNYYYAIFENYKGEYSKRAEDCIIIFTEKEDRIIVNVFGDDVNTAIGYFGYNGLYIRTEPLNHIEEEKLNNILSDYYNVEMVKKILGLNIRYFLEIFEQIEIKNINGNIIIEGWIPGGNRFSNGIIKIEEKFIYILFGDTRNETREYKYYTNNFSEEFPIEFTEWRHFPRSDNIEIKKWCDGKYSYDYEIS